MRHARIYLDQNIIGHIYDRHFNLGIVPNVDWIYSAEHFEEIERSGNTSLLSVFEILRAQLIEVAMDSRSQFTDGATLYSYSSPYEKYERYLDHKNDVMFDERLLTDIMSRLFGADNYQDVANFPERLKSQLEALLIQAGIVNGCHQNLIEQMACDLDDFIKDNLSETRPLESSRIPLGTDRGRVGNPKTDNPIMDIWEIVKDRIQGVTPDQFFGFAPINSDEGERSLYQGIIACHTVLNFIGYGTDKGIAAADKLPNILSDAKHIATAAFCDAVMSEDKRFCKKASAIYRYKNHHTRVLRITLNHLNT